MMRFSSIISEAWRNTISGTSRLLMTASILTVLIGGLALVHVITIGNVLRDTYQWRNAGASIHILNVPGGINGKLCESLSRIEGIHASGALRSGPTLTLAQLPQNPMSSLEVSPGMEKVLHVEAPHPQTRGGGMWVSSDLAALLSDDASPSSLILHTDSDTSAPNIVPVSGIFPQVEDGRAPIFARNIVIPVAAHGLFDACWAEIWPESSALEQLLTYAVVNGQEDSAQAETQLFNTSQGQHFDVTKRLGPLPFWFYTAAAICFAQIIGIAFSWSRRLEGASALHAGVDRLSFVIQLTVEYGFAALLSWTVLLPILFFTSTVLGIIQWNLWGSGILIVSASYLCGALGVILGALRIQENQLFALFKAR
ncbi:hypothetical protein [Schaalia sp. lx-100]|uniref:hypothetical protein n=1 Tax=Schaalia sp. lx-100 TaxID=2899081 RepID=UPI001E4F5281|nr:hypothetical protein [Schaalia sp. lx-100]MCD4557361.1 hypothetical protein [Schaalia sp. lx-100]